MLFSPLQGLSRLIPSQCMVCHCWPSEPVCEHCIARFAQPQERCHGCALPLPDAQPYCGACLGHPPPWKRCLATVDYSYPWNQVLAEFKFHEHLGLAHSLAKLMRAAPWVEASLEQADLLIPMPLSAQRLQDRGFNQSAVLAQALGHPCVAQDLLLRIRHSPPQSSLDRATRLRNVRNAYLPHPLKAATIRNRHIVVLDDVMTTGASLVAAAQALQQAGAASITALVLARTSHDSAS